MDTYLPDPDASRAPPPRHRAQHARDPQRWQRQPHEQAQCRGAGDRDGQDRQAPSPCPAGQLCDHGAQLAREPTSSTLVALERPGYLLTKRLPTTSHAGSLYRHHHPSTVDRRRGDRPPSGCSRRAPAPSVSAHRARYRLIARPGHDLNEVVLALHTSDDQGRQTRKHHTRKIVDLRHGPAWQPITQRHHRLRARAVGAFPCQRVAVSPGVQADQVDGDGTDDVFEVDLLDTAVTGAA